MTEALEAQVNDDSDEYEELEEYDAPPPRSLGWILVVGGVLSFIASFILSAERVEMLKDPNYMPTCSINDVLKCSTVMGSSQGELFGFPNPFIGLAAFPIVILSGALALSSARVPSWFWRWLLVGSTYGIVLVGWLIFQSLYEIRALCPYCMVVWACVIPIFWRTLGFTLADGHFGPNVAAAGISRFLGRFWWLLTLISYAAVTTMVLIAFRYAFF
ncbi:vitamin K epoxide reductase family protein [Cumulibacter soli]|uniref:vitamin K epoxide reductase family protein n=1 Tax=Cumulibacter soli TaxID=2546344 RepID=UPI0010683D5D|nr:vitamin K epoxide reductase family protein [Cumulibacter soli]